jgi:hypothetical protein
VNARSNPRPILGRAYQHFWLVEAIDVLHSGLPELSMRSDPSSRTASVLAVAPSPRGLDAALSGEASLSRELRTPPLPATHVSVGYR